MTDGSGTDPDGSGPRISKLDNGIRVATDTLPELGTASLGIWVEVGTRHERKELNGISHMLEHMAFKGTSKRSAFDIAAAIEDVGGHLNAYTTREHTAYYARVLSDDVALAFDVVADIVRNAEMSPEEIARERAVIVQEINQANDQPEDVVFDAFQRLAYPDQALGRPVLGLAEVVSGFDREKLLGFLEQSYGGSRIIVAAAGKVDHDQLLDLAGQAFDGRGREADVVLEKASYGGGGDWREKRDLEQVQIALGFDGLAYADDDFFAASVYSTILGGGMSSRLFQEVREKRGLVYNVYSFMSCYGDGGLFGIHLGTGEAEAAEALPVVCDTLLESENTISEAEIARARAQLKASTLMSLESTASRCEQIANQLMVFGRPLSVEEIITKVDAVDLAAVKSVARRLRSSKPILTALGPISKVEAYDTVLDRLSA
ncbi:MAG: M16 family metallopeptidase [Magnetovibrionaceae bacterium]